MPSLPAAIAQASFHSISFPSEWGVVEICHDKASHVECFHSISFPSEWGVILSVKFTTMLSRSSFHSISFPSEWGEGARPGMEKRR